MADIDAVLLGKINAAVAEHNAAERAVTTAQSELVSRSKVVGQLLLEAKKRHPKVADFEAFLERVNGLKLSRAYDLLRLAGSRTTDEELRQDARERKQKSRAKKKLPPKASSLPDNTKPPLSVTDPPVTESRITQSPEISAEDRREQNAALDTETPDLSIPPFLDRTNDGPTSLEDWENSAEFRRAQDVAWSRSNLKEFIRYCRVKLPTITEEADRQAALRIVTEILANKKAKAARHGGPQLDHSEDQGAARQDDGQRRYRS